MLTLIALTLALQAAPSPPLSRATPDAAPPAVQARDSFDDAFARQSGFGPDGFSACLPSGNAAAHLARVNEQIRTVNQLLEAELQQRGATPRLAAMRELLADDSEMKLARYFVQTIADESCKP